MHRDVKPANILVAPEDRAYLSDFGVVKELASGGTTRTGSFVGTIDYCAPEQIEGRAVDARTDVYALACVLYECLTGTPPFHRPSEVAVLNAHLHAPPPRLTGVVPELPSPLGAAAALLLRPVFVEKRHAALPPATTVRQPTLSDTLLRSNDGRTLNDVAFALIGVGEYVRALPFARKAIARAPPGASRRATRPTTSVSRC